MVVATIIFFALPPSTINYSLPRKEPGCEGQLRDIGTGTFHCDEQEYSRTETLMHQCNDRDGHSFFIVHRQPYPIDTEYLSDDEIKEAEAAQSPPEFVVRNIKNRQVNLSLHSFSTPRVSCTSHCDCVFYEGAGYSSTEHGLRYLKGQFAPHTETLEVQALRIESRLSKHLLWLWLWYLMLPAVFVHSLHSYLSARYPSPPLIKLPDGFTDRLVDIATGLFSAFMLIAGMIILIYSIITMNFDKQSLPVQFLTSVTLCVGLSFPILHVLLGPERRLLSLLTAGSLHVLLLVVFWFVRGLISYPFALSIVLAALAVLCTRDGLNWLIKRGHSRDDSSSTQFTHLKKEHPPRM